MKQKFILQLSLFLTILFFNFSALSNSIPQFQHIVFFGDSLSDNGNLYDHSDRIIPKSPPYFDGRFSNGYIWTDLISYKLLMQYNIDAANYAVGGATAFLHDPFQGYLPVSLSMEVSDYSLRNLMSDKDNTLYVIWIGANDYLQGATDVDQATTGVVNSVISAVNSLAGNTNAQFFIVQLPEIELTPEARIKNLADNYLQLVTMHNQKLHDAVVNLRAQHPNNKIFEFSFIDHPVLKEIVKSKAFRDQINQEYGVNITDVSDSCWGGGYTKTPSTRAIEKTLEITHKINGATLLNTKVLAAQIKNSPSLLVTYQIGQRAAAGDQACATPDQYVFWDDVHPTASVHKVLAAMFLDTILTNQ